MPVIPNHFNHRATADALRGDSRCEEVKDKTHCQVLPCLASIAMALYKEISTVTNAFVFWKGGAAQFIDIEGCLKSKKLEKHWFKKTCCVSGCRSSISKKQLHLKAQGPGRKGRVQFFFLIWQEKFENDSPGAYNSSWKNRWVTQDPHSSPPNSQNTNTAPPERGELSVAMTILLLNLKGTS